MNVRITLDGRTALVLHSDQTANPRNQYAKKLKELTSKRQKTDEDHEAIARLEWEAGWYGSRSDLPIMPTWNVIACIAAGGAKVRLKSKILSALVPLDTVVPIAYNGPGFSDLTVDTPGFAFEKTVVVQRSRTVRTRPCIPVPWQIELDAVLDLTELNPDDLQRAADLAGKLVGLGDARTLTQGRFEATIKEGE